MHSSFNASYNAHVVTSCEGQCGNVENRKGRGGGEGGRDGRKIVHKHVWRREARISMMLKLSKFQEDLGIVSCNPSLQNGCCRTSQMTLSVFEMGEVRR